MPQPSRYERLIADVFHARYRPDARQVNFERQDIEAAAERLGIFRPKNLGDVVYSFRYRRPLPESIRDLAPPGESWVIMPAGPARYSFVATTSPEIRPSPIRAVTKIPDATPGLITAYALSDEQALLARLRYNRMIDIFTGVTTYSLQSHLRTSVTGLGQVETDEIYVGIDARGRQFVFPVQAKGGRDILSVVQIAQDFEMVAEKFPDLLARPIAAQFMMQERIAMFELVREGVEVRVLREEHYRLVPPDEITAEELASYRLRAQTEGPAQ